MAAKKKGARHMREWSAGDMKKLRQFAKQKVSARVAAQKLGRSPGAVRYKAMMEGVSFRSINRKKYPRSHELPQNPSRTASPAARGAPRPAIRAGLFDSER